MAFLGDELPRLWLPAYRSFRQRPTEIVAITRGDFEFLFDDYTSLEAQGVVPYDPHEEGRVVAVYGCSVPSVQRRALNRGWSAEGKRFRAMESFCASNPGTFCFARPIYWDGTAQPAFLEFGVLRHPHELWVETFDNR